MRRLLLVAVLLCGCEQAKKRDNTTVPLDQVPAAAMKAAKEKLPDVTFDSAWKVENDAFEIRGKNSKGRIRDLQVTASGEVLEVD